MRALGTILLSLTLCCSACGRTDSASLHDDGQETVRSIVRELERVETREQLESKVPKLRRLFEDLVDTMIRAQELNDGEAIDRPARYSAKLKAELIRIYGIDGGRNLIEQAQDTALLRLDTYERSRR